MSDSVGAVLIVLGLALVLAGVLIVAGGLSWFGNLPGDIRIERDSVRIYIPLGSMLVVSIFLSLAMYIVRRLL